MRRVFGDFYDGHPSWYLVAGLAAFPEFGPDRHVLSRQVGRDGHELE